MESLRRGDPAQVGDYRLLGRLGAGGMGQVFLGRSPLGRTVAVKLVHPQLAYDQEFRRRFRAEVAAARRVGGEWTAPVLDADTEADTPWVATGYVAGPTLHQAVAEICGPLPERSVWHLAFGLARALRSIHDCGLVHRDLKPSNVMLTINGPRVIDFGVARAADASVLTRTGAVVGSPGFMSPEQIMGGEVTGLSDVFSLGLVLVFAATGRQAFGGPDSGPHAIMMRVTEDAPDLDGLPEPLAEFVGRCLAKRPEDRLPLPEIVAVAEARADSGSDAWLPGALLAELGRHASSLLDLEEPAPTQVDTPAPGRGGDSVHALPTMQAGRFPPQPPGAPTPAPMPPVPTPMPASMPPMPTPTGSAPPMPPVPGFTQPGGGRRSRVGPVLLTMAVVAVLAVVLVSLLPDSGSDGNQAGAGSSGTATSAAKSPKLSLADYVGKWNGTIRDGDSDYTVKVDFAGGDVGDQVATVQYPSLECRGLWTLSGESAGVLRLREEITEETSLFGCIDTVDLTLTPLDDDSLRYEIPGNDDAGTLHRSK